MKNRSVGYLILAFSLVVGIITYIFNRALTQIVDTSCSHGVTCPMWGTLEFHTNLAIFIMAFIVIVGLYLVFKKDEKEIIIKTKRIKIENKPDLKNIEKYKSKLTKEEKLTIEEIIKNKGSIYQSELVEKTGINKVKITRILNHLESYNLIERKRQGMTNIVVLKSK